MLYDSDVYLCSSDGSVVGMYVCLYQLYTHLAYHSLLQSGTD